MTAGEVAWSAHAARGIATFPFSPAHLFHSHLLCGATAPRSRGQLAVADADEAMAAFLDADLDDLPHRAGFGHLDALHILDHGRRGRVFVEADIPE